MAQWQIVSASPRQTEHIGRIIGTFLQPGDTVALRGELGTGKTTLIRGIAAGLEALPHRVSSPTFTLIHEYRGRLRLVHADLYRLRSEREALSIGLEDYLDRSTTAAVEWIDRCPALLPGDRLDIDIAHRTPRTRAIGFHAAGAMSVRLLADVTSEYLRQHPKKRKAAHSSSKRGKRRL